MGEGEQACQNDKGRGVKIHLHPGLIEPSNRSGAENPDLATEGRGITPRPASPALEGRASFVQLFLHEQEKLERDIS